MEKRGREKEQSDYWRRMVLCNATWMAWDEAYQAKMGWLEAICAEQL